VKRYNSYSEMGESPLGMYVLAGDALALQRQLDEKASYLNLSQAAHRNDRTLLESYKQSNDQLRADLLTTRRALKRAQAAALRGQAKFLTHGDWGEIRPGKQSWWSECYQREIDRGARLLNHYAALFERQAVEMK
jgi:hypothetical protein